MLKDAALGEELLVKNWLKEPDNEVIPKILSTLEEAYELTDHDWDCYRLTLRCFIVLSCKL